MYTTFLDGVKLELAEEHDFSWINKYGRVFAVFDKQDSGNIAFGVEGMNGKMFIKYAGARNTEYEGSIAEAIYRLKKSAAVYDNIKHPNLIELLEHGEMGGGYLCVFRWAKGECMNAHWNFDEFPKYTHPMSPNYRFARLDAEKKLQCIKTILEVQSCVSRAGYVGVDFYDGSVMYDFENFTTTICDIDMFEKIPYINTMGKMWGSSRFMSPEEYVVGQPIDEITNVYTMGAMMFELLGSSTERDLATWTVGEGLFYVAKKAVSENREERYGSIAQLIEAFNNNC